jgi:acetoin utilization protein AcuB
MRRIPRIKSVMTPFPYSIASWASLEDALSMMGEHGIRTLPVYEGHSVIGILSEGDARIALGIWRGDASLKVKDVCTEAYLVDLECRLDEVAAEMATRRVGSAIVMRGGRLAGILTTTDVCRLLAATLREAYGTDEDDDVA